MKSLALGLELPGVEETVSWGQPTLKAFGKLWVWWNPRQGAPVFKLPFADRDFLLQVDPETFFAPPHDMKHPRILVRPDRLDPDWARRTLVDTWRTLAPKRVLRNYDAARANDQR